MSLISAKGGVGTSTLTKELAIAFSKDVSVCLVDMALSCPAQETLFRILPSHKAQNRGSFPTVQAGSGTLSYACHRSEYPSFIRQTGERSVPSAS